MRRRVEQAGSDPRRRPEQIAEPSPTSASAFGDSRLVSITFDDGFRGAAETAMPILDRHGLAATFYVVTGWVEPMRAPVSDPFNAHRSHGDWAFWQEVVTHGHEVGSHGFSHVNATGRKARLLPWMVPQEIARSAADLRRHLPASGFTMSMPWNMTTRASETHVRRLFSACRLGGSQVEYNLIDDLHPFALRSWAPGPQHGWDAYARAIDDLPDGGWLIFQFHSFDDEGWEPISPRLFDQLCRLLADCSVKVATVQAIASSAADF